MKSTFAILTLLVVALNMVPRPSYGQYAWVPVYTDGEISGETGYTAFIDDELEDFDNELEDFDDSGFVENSKGTKGCDCANCQRKLWSSRTFIGLEYLHWYNKGRSLPPLVTGGDPTTTPFANAGILPTAPILFGGDEVGDDLMVGGRITGGLWLNDCRTSALVIRAFGNEGDNTIYSAASNGNTILAIPFVDQGAALSGQNNALVLAYSGGVTAGINAQGSVVASASNDIVGGDIYGRTMLDQGTDYRLDALAGYQATRIDDDLILNTALQRFDLGGSPTFTTSDLFDVENQYNAFTLGLLGEFYHGPLTVQMMGKIGIGNMHQEVEISGSNTVNGILTGGGLFAQDQAANGGPTFNIGSYERDLLVWSPEVSVKAVYCVSERISLSVGYTFLYWTRVALAGDQLDTNVNRDVLFDGPFQAGGGANPAFAFRDTDFWVQTIDIGLLLNY